MKLICPHCRGPSVWQENPFRPFCSDRCKAHDLGGWATEKFRIEGEAKEPASVAKHSSPPKTDEE